MTRFPGLGSRFADRLHTLGFWKDDRPDVGRFCREKGYRPQYVYAWLKDRMPAYDNMRRLCVDLDVTVVWFVTGDEALAATNGRRARRPHGRLAHRGNDGRRTAVASALPVGTHLDLAPLREATDRIASLQAELEALVAAFPDPCLWIDESGRILDVKGPRTAAIPRESTGRMLRDAITAEAAAMLSRAVSRALRGNDIVTVECQLARDGARPRTYEARIRPVAATRSRRPRKALVVLHDVTEHKQRAHEFRELVEGAANGLCVHDDSGIRFANRAMARMLGYATPLELVGREIRQVFPDPRIPRTPTAIRESSTVRRTSAAVKRDGQRIAVEALVRPITWQSRSAIMLTLLTVVKPSR